MKVLSTQSESQLRAAIESLGEPAAPRTRVYRGQSSRYFLDQTSNVDSLLPRLLRSEVKYDANWLGAVKRLANHIKNVAPARTLFPAKGLHQVLAAA